MERNRVSDESEIREEKLKWRPVRGGRMERGREGSTEGKERERREGEKNGGRRKGGRD